MNCCGVAVTLPWQTQGAQSISPKTLVTVELSVAPQVCIQQAEKKQAVFNEMLFRSSVPVPHAVGQSCAGWWHCLAMSLSLCPQAATPPSCAWCAAAPWLRSTAPAPAAGMPSVSAAASSHLAAFHLAMPSWAQGNGGYVFCCIMHLHHSAATTRMEFESRVLNSVWFWNFKNDLTDWCTFQLFFSLRILLHLKTLFSSNFSFLYLSYF